MHKDVKKCLRDPAEWVEDKSIDDVATDVSGVVDGVVCDGGGDDTGNKGDVGNSVVTDWLSFEGE